MEEPTIESLIAQVREGRQKLQPQYTLKQTPVQPTGGCAKFDVKVAFRGGPIDRYKLGVFSKSLDALENLANQLLCIGSITGKYRDDREIQVHRGSMRETAWKRLKSYALSSRLVVSVHHQREFYELMQEIFDKELGIKWALLDVGRQKLAGPTRANGGYVAGIRIASLDLARLRQSFQYESRFTCAWAVVQRLRRTERKAEKAARRRVSGSLAGADDWEMDDADDTEEEWAFEDGDEQGGAGNGEATL